MRELEATFGRAAQIWWAWFWRSILFSFLFAIIIGFMAGLAEGILGLDRQHVIPANLVLGTAVGLIVSIWVLTKVLKKKFSSFRIALIED